MLNRAILLEQLQKVSGKIFSDTVHDLSLAYQSWKRITADPFFYAKVRQIQSPWLVPEWFDALEQTTACQPETGPYAVLAVDGSQVYPDKHQGTSCSLINIGSALFQYKIPHTKPVTFKTMPFVFGEYDEQLENCSPELINAKRQELELEVSFMQGLDLKQQLPSGIPSLILIDGPLVFWHLEAKDVALKELFLSKYLSLLQSMYQELLLYAGYISLPRSKELVNLLKLERCNFVPERYQPHAAIDALVDSTILNFFLPVHHSTILFKSKSPIVEWYPAHLAPYFFYCDVGFEIVRIEIPQWIAQNADHCKQVTALILDQVIKGMGYPIALAESHEQAVIKGPDRDFFYHLITKLGIEKKRNLLASQKSMKKRGMGI